MAFQSLHKTTQTIAGRFLCPRAEIALLVLQQPLAQYALCARSDYANLIREDPSDSQPAMLAFILRDRDARIILINTLEDRTDGFALPALQDYAPHFPGKVAIPATAWSFFVSKKVFHQALASTGDIAKVAIISRGEAE